jgi:hypothetical protein
MIAEERECKLDVSEFYLRLTTESIRLFSNKVRGLANFREVIDDRAAVASLLPKYYTKAEMNEHLSIIPTNGDISLKFTILETSAASLDEAAKMLSDSMGLSVAFADTLSLLMYDFILEENKTEVLTKLGLSSEQASNYRDILKKKPSNVVPFPK